MRTNEEGQKLIKDVEALRLEAYYCSAGKCTIGWGSTTYTDGSPIKPGDKINIQTAQELFEFHMKKVEDAISMVLMKPVTSNEFSAMASLCYNIGTEAFKKSTLVKMLNAGNDKNDIANQFLVWNKAKIDGVFKVQSGLIKRREKERQLFLKE